MSRIPSARPPRLSSAGAIPAALVLAGALATQTPVFDLYGSVPGANFGNSVGAAGDVDADGFGDLIVGVSGDSGNTGAARVYSGRDGRVLRTFRPINSNTDRFGSTVGGAGDVDADGFADVIVSTSTDPRHGVDTGSVTVFSGRTGAVLHLLYGDGPGDLFGTSCAAVGDVDRDGFGDFVIGAPENGGDPVQHYGAGYARLFSGRLGTVLATFRGVSVTDEFGAVVGAAGDMDRDGYPDVIVTSLLEGGGHGSARVFSGRDFKPLHQIAGEVGGDHFGMSAAAVADLDKDGHPDLVVGGINPFSHLAGMVSVYSGRTGATLFQIRGSQKSGMFGHCVGSAGDLNGDGFGDFFAGDPMDGSLGSPIGSLRVFSGRDASQLSVTYRGGGFGSRAAVIGDLGGDGLPEVLLAMPGAQRGGMNVGQVTVMSLADVTRVGVGCTSGPVTSRLDMTHAVIGRSLMVFLGDGPRNGIGALLLSRIPEAPAPLYGSCQSFLDPASTAILSSMRTDASGRWAMIASVPNDRNLIGLGMALQSALKPGSPLGFDWSNGVYFTIR